MVCTYYNIIIARTCSERVKSPAATPLGVGVTAYFVVIITVFFPPDIPPYHHTVQISASPTTHVCSVCVDIHVSQLKTKASEIY